MALLKEPWAKVRINMFRNRSANLVLTSVECIPHQITWLDLLTSNGKLGFDPEHHEIYGLLHRTNIARSGLDNLVSHTLDQWSQKAANACYKVHLFDKVIPRVRSVPQVRINLTKVSPLVRYVWQKDSDPPFEVTAYNIDMVLRTRHPVICYIPPEVLLEITMQQVWLGLPSSILGRPRDNDKDFDDDIYDYWQSEFIPPAGPSPFLPQGTIPMNLMTQHQRQPQVASVQYRTLQEDIGISSPTYQENGLSIPGHNYSNSNNDFNVHSGLSQNTVQPAQPIPSVGAKSPGPSSAPIPQPFYGNVDAARHPMGI